MAIIGGIFGYIKFTEQPSPEEEKAALGYVEEAFNDPDAPLTENEKFKALYPDSLDEYTVQNKIHNMSHQKVQAEEKWGHEQITKPKVDRLLEVVKANETNYEHEATYIKILERWADGDFSNAVEDHNAVWKLQEGTIGEAYRLMSPVEEWRYIQQYFLDKE